MSLAMRRSRVGAMSREAWNGTVVPRPSGCRYCRWDPRCRTNSKPSWSSRADFAGLENGGRAQRLSDLDGMCSYELGFEPGLAVLKQHLYDLLQIGQEFIDRCALRMCARPARNMAHVGPGVAVPFYNCRIATHGNLPIRKLLYNNKLHGSGPVFLSMWSATDDAKTLGTRIPPAPTSHIPPPTWEEERKGRPLPITLTYDHMFLLYVMLDILFGSKARVALLARMLLQPDDELHLSDLVRQTGFAPRSIQLEADRLVSLGVLNERRSGNRRYLSANIRHNLYDPLRQLLERTVGIAPILCKALADDARIERAVVYGSYAAGEARPESDIDLLIVGSVTLQEVLQITSPLQDRFNLEINPVVMTEEEFRTRRSEQEHFICSVLASPTVPLVGDLNDAG